MLNVGDEVRVVRRQERWFLCGTLEEEPYTVIGVREGTVQELRGMGHPQMLTLRDALGKEHVASGLWFDPDESSLLNPREGDLKS